MRYVCFCFCYRFTLHTIGIFQQWVLCAHWFFRRLLQSRRCSAFNWMTSVSSSLLAFALTSRYDTTSLSFSYISLLGIFLLRTFAIYQRNWPVFVILGAPGFLLLTTNIVIFHFSLLLVLLTSFKSGRMSCVLPLLFLHSSKSSHGHAGLRRLFLPLPG